MSWTGRALALILVLATSSGVACHKKQERHRIDVAAAASLRDAMPALASAFEKRSGLKVAVTYGASGELVDLARAGRKIDAVLLADRQSFERLVAAGLASSDAGRTVARNSIVLVSSRPSSLRFATLERIPAGATIAIGDPDKVPAGRYARAHLRRIGKWNAIEDRTRLAGDVAAVLAAVLRGEADFGVVYATDTLGQPKIQVLDHGHGPPRPEVVAAPLSSAPGAGRFLDFVESPEGRRLLRAHGFEPAAGGAPHRPPAP